MFAEERRKKIIELINEFGRVEVDDLANELNVSTMTIRRDLDYLQNTNMIKRCHGGAVATIETSYFEKSVKNVFVKSQIAKKCMEYIKEGDTIFLDAGTTTFKIAEQIVEKKLNVTIFTNDLEIATFLKNTDIDLYICGGSVQKKTGSILGYYADEMLSDFKFDVGFFGAATINSEYEVMTPTIEKMSLKRNALKSCINSFLVVDSTKFNKQAKVKINDISDYSGVISDYNFDDYKFDNIIKI